MRPQIAIDIVLQQASAFLGQPLGDGRAAEMGADHLVVFASAPTLGHVVIKVGEDAETDAYVLDQLRNLPVRVPRLLARGTIGPWAREPVTRGKVAACFVNGKSTLARIAPP